MTNETLREIGYENRKSIFRKLLVATSIYVYWIVYTVLHLIHQFHSFLSPAVEETLDIINLISAILILPLGYMFFHHYRSLYVESELRTAILDNITDVVLVTDEQGIVAFSNRKSDVIVNQHGSNIDEIVELYGTGNLVTLNPISSSPFNRALHGERIRNELFLMRDQYKKLRHVLISAKPIISPMKRVLGSVSILRDVTELHEIYLQLQLREEQYRLIAENSADLISIISHDGVVLYASPSFERITGKTPSELMNKRAFSLVHPDDVSRVKEKFEAILYSGVADSIIFRYRSVTGEWLHVEGTATPARDEDQQIRGLVVSMRDISERVAHLDKINLLAYWDERTELPNQNATYKYLEEVLESQADELSVLVIEAQSLWEVLDLSGYHGSSDVVRQITDRIKQAIGEGSFLGILDGSRWCVVLHTTQTEEIMRVANRIAQSFKHPFVTPTRLFDLDCIMGIAIWDADTSDVDNLVTRADVARAYCSRNAGESAYVVYTKAMTEQLSRRNQLKGYLKNAIENDELMLFYQPRICTEKGTISGVEALLRWFNPQVGSVPPTEFIPIAEEMGIIMDIGNWVIHEACRQRAEWNAKGVSPFRIAVNVSALQFTHGDLIETVDEAIQRYSLSLSDIEIEVTESIFVQNSEKVVHTIDALRDRGIMIALDDFGTGYSSLSYLTRLDVNHIKIDRSFVMDCLTPNSNARVLILSIISLAHSMGKSVVAEGVETQEQLDFLRMNQCDEWQGYFCSKPVPADQLEELISSSRWEPSHETHTTK